MHQQVSRPLCELQSSQELSGSSDIFHQKKEKVKLIHFSYVYLPF